VFVFLIIYVVVTTPIVMLFVPESPYRVKQRFDIIGAVLFGASIGLILLYVSQGSTWGWANFGSLSYGIGGAVLFALFIEWELHTPEPMIELHLLRAPKVLFLMIIAFLVTMWISTVSIAVAYMMETPKPPALESAILSAAAAQAHVAEALVAHFVTFKGDIGYANGFSIMQMALHITIWTALFGMLSGVLGGWLARKIGARIPLIIAGASMLIASGLWVFWHKTWQEQLFIGLFYGVAFGFYYASTPNLLMDAVPANRQGISAGMLAVFGSIGTSVGTAIFTAIASAHPFQITASVPKPSVTNVPDVYTNTAYSLTYLILGVIPGVIVVILAVVLRTGRTPARGGAAEETQSPVAEAVA
jgi:nitrate/nitrite transporter NarK